MTLFRRLIMVIFLFSLPFLPGIFAQHFYPGLREYCYRLSKEISSVPADRKDSLTRIGNYVMEIQQEHDDAEILFAGKKNASLSQLAEIWSYVASRYYKISHIKVCSGGITPGAFNYRVAAALKRCGFFIMPGGGYANNPVYFINLGRDYPDYSLFAKSLDYYLNPHAGYLVIPVCPGMDSVNYTVFGAQKVIPFHWKDPALWNDTPMETRKYDQCSHEIARDMFFLMNYIVEKDKADKKKRRKKKK